MTVTVQGAEGRRVTFALGELDPSFGNHPAVLALVERGRHLMTPALVVPGDTSPLRSIDQVSAITVGVANPTPTTPPAGAVDLHFHGRQFVLTARELSRLPSQTLRVTFIAGTASQTDTEQRPLLLSLVEDGAALTQPQLVTDGDVKGGRYVSLVVDLVVGEGGD